MSLTLAEDDDTILSFIAEWFEPVQQKIKRYLLKYYVASHEVGMKDVSNGRKFLKRTKIQSNEVKKSDFFVGSSITLLSRDLKLVEYGDNQTRIVIEADQEEVLLLFPLKHNNSLVKVIRTFEDARLTLTRAKTFHFDNIEVMKMMMNLNDDFFIQAEEARCFAAFVFKGNATRNVANQIKEQIGKDSEDGGNNLLIPQESYMDTFNQAIFDFNHIKTVTYDPVESTCCIIKPHILKSLRSGAVLQHIISKGYEINAMEAFNVDRSSAEEFCAPYKGVVEEYNGMVEEFCSGTLLALEVKGQVELFRKDVGPYKVETAKMLPNESIRGVFGENDIQNAVHCTDLCEDNVHEVSFFFEKLQKRK
jgi:nucleoside-diphosphate kinase